MGLQCLMLRGSAAACPEAARRHSQLEAIAGMLETGTLAPAVVVLTGSIDACGRVQREVAAFMTARHVSFLAPLCARVTSPPSPSSSSSMHSRRAASPSLLVTCATSRCEEDWLTTNAAAMRRLPLKRPPAPIPTCTGMEPASTKKRSRSALKTTTKRCSAAAGISRAAASSSLSTTPTTPRASTGGRHPGSR